MGNIMSRRRKPLKHEGSNESSSEKSSNTTVNKKKKRKHTKKKSEKLSDAASIDSGKTPAKKRSSFTKTFSQRSKKKKPANGSENNRKHKGLEDVEENQMNFPEIVITSPSDVEASIEKEHRAKRTSSMSSEHSLKSINKDEDTSNEIVAMVTADDAPVQIEKEHVEDDDTSQVVIKQSSSQIDADASRIQTLEENVEAQNHNRGEKSGENEEGCKAETDTQVVDPSNTENQLHFSSVVEAKQTQEAQDTDTQESDTRKGHTNDILNVNTCTAETSSSIEAKPELVNKDTATALPQSTSNELEESSTNIRSIVLSLLNEIITKTTLIVEASAIESKMKHIDGIEAFPSVTQPLENSFLENSVTETVSERDTTTTTVACLPEECEDASVHGIRTDQNLVELDSSAFNNAEDAWHKTNAAIIKHIMPNADVIYMEEFQFPNLSNASSPARSPRVSCNGEDTFYSDEKAPPNVIANLSLTSQSGSMSSVDQQSVLEDTLQQESQESQKEKFFTTPQQEENVNNNNSFNGNLSPKTTLVYTNGSSESPLPTVPKSAPPAATKPSYRELSAAPSSLVKEKQVDEFNSEIQDIVVDVTPTRKNISDEDWDKEPIDLKVELGTGAMAGLAREGQSYRHLSGVPTRQVFKQGTDDKEPEPRRRRRSRQASLPSTDAQELSKQSSVDKSPLPSPDDCKSPPPPVAPRPKSRSGKTPPVPPKASSAVPSTQFTFPEGKRERISDQPYKKASYRLYASLPRPKTLPHVEPPPPPTAKKIAPQDRMSFRDRRKYFEEIKQESTEEASNNNNGSVGKRKKISLVSAQDMRTIKREEEKKYGTLSKEDIRKSMDFAEEDEEEDIVEEMADIPADVRPNSTIYIEGKEYKVEKKPQKLSARERLNPRYNAPASASSEEDLIRSLEQDVVRASHVAEGDADDSALSERLKVTSPEVKREMTSSHDLSPAERRALEAEKRKQWRQARFKSLEADALQAQVMLQQRGRKSDVTGASGAQTRALS